jgi:hypothetical protein
MCIRRIGLWVKYANSVMRRRPSQTGWRRVPGLRRLCGGGVSAPSQHFRERILLQSARLPEMLRSSTT